MGGRPAFWRTAFTYALPSSGRPLRLPQGLDQTFLHDVGGVVGTAQLRLQHVHGLADAAGLVDAALLADGQVQRQVQEGVAAADFGAVVGFQRPIQVSQLVVIFRMLADPLQGDHLQGLQRGALLVFLPDVAEVAAHVGDGGIEEHGRRGRADQALR